MKIISFSGVDGSGKSTQRELLQKYFELQGYHVAYFHATEFSLANRLQRKSKRQDTFTPGEEPSVTKAGFVSVLLRLIFLALDGLRFPSFVAHHSQAGVQIIISDRFFQDSLINAAYLSQNPLIRFFIRLLAKSLPTPQPSFYLKLSAEDILRRSRVPEQGINYLQEKITLYNKPPFTWNTTVLDATKDPQTIHNEVVTLLS